MNQEARTKLVKARIAMIMQQPFFGTLALRLRLVENDKLNPPTLAVDGKTMYYHPQWVLDNDHDVCMSGVAHEVGHCVFQHIGRRNGREPRRWNHAGDYVINAVLKDSGFTVPPTWLHSPTFAGMSTDQVYQALPPDPPGDAFDGIADAPPADTDPLTLWLCTEPPASTSPLTSPQITEASLWRLASGPAHSTRTTPLSPPTTCLPPTVTVPLLMTICALPSV